MAGEPHKEAPQLDEFEKSQDALRRSIEAAKQLTDSSQQLLDRHRGQGGEAPEQASTTRR